MCLPLLLSSKTALVTNYLLTPSTSMVGGRIYRALSLALFLISLTQQPHFNTMLALTSSTLTRLCSTGRQTSERRLGPRVSLVAREVTVSFSLVVQI
mmetsp:Transcript_23090/g.64751  ORF Transcript_23090/g.64751 Transcript_23090/m.64751 type:complete len:97 (+) Transcript_23090:2603-2893(+)